MRALTIVLLATLAVVGATVKKAIEVAIEKEYATWAFAIASLLTRTAGYICRSYRDDWSADLAYRQQVEKQAGLFIAGSCLLCSPWLALRSARLGSQFAP